MKPNQWNNTLKPKVEGPEIFGQSRVNDTINVIVGTTDIPTRQTEIATNATPTKPNSSTRISKEWETRSWADPIDRR